MDITGFGDLAASPKLHSRPRVSQSMLRLLSQQVLGPLAGGGLQACASEDGPSLWLYLLL